MLAQSIKDAATAAFKDNAKLANMTAQERETAARFYEVVAQQTVGTRAALARLYNLERARFLRGEVRHIAATALQFGQEIGFEQGSNDDIQVS